jgi:hypothetical protein
MEKSTNNQPKSITYLFLALLAFGFLGMEFGVLFISRIIDGRTFAQIGNWPIHWYGAIAHWTITMIIWLFGYHLILAWMKRREVREDLVDFTFHSRVYDLIFMAVVIVAISALIQSLVNDAQIPQVFFEFKGFEKMYGGQALIVTFFQVLYYFMEMLLVTLMIILFQQFGEMVFKKKYIPYGSIGLMLTWGMIHFISHPAGALGVTIWALIPGLLFVYGNKSFWPVYLLLVLGFII